jgi:ABC-type transport system substrate-binding protein
MQQFLLDLVTNSYAKVCNACAKEGTSQGPLAAQLLVIAHATAPFMLHLASSLHFSASKPRPKELNSCAPDIRCFLLPRQWPSDFSWPATISAQAETVVRYGISMADIPLTTGQPDRGAGAYQFSAYTIYDPLVAWEMDVSDRPGKLVPGLATEWKVDETDKKKWRFALRKGVKFHDGSEFNADAVIWNLDKVLNDKAPQFDKRQSAQVKDPPALGRELRQDRRRHGRDHHQDGRFVLPLPDALVPGLQPRAI